MAAKLIAVKTYHLSDDDVNIAFSMEDQASPKLEYTDENHELEFSGRQIHLENTQLGLLASVILEQVMDAYTITLSLAVPAANRNENQKSIMIKSFAVRTTSRTTIAGPDPIEGPIDTYEALMLEGNAW